MRTKIAGVLAVALFCALAVFGVFAPADAAENKTSILVIWGDDFGIWNISHNSRCF